MENEPIPVKFVTVTGMVICPGHWVTEPNCGGYGKRTGNSDPLMIMNGRIYFSTSVLIFL